VSEPILNFMVGESRVDLNHQHGAVQISKNGDQITLSLAELAVVTGGSILLCKSYVKGHVESLNREINDLCVALPEGITPGVVFREVK
jgi:hypothetical protein